jgi:hypothetical protein
MKSSNHTRTDSQYLVFSGGCNKRCLLLLLSVIALAISTAARPAAGETPPIGFRGDGSGVFPDDCTPVTEWNWTDRKNIVWVKDFGRTANWGNASSPIVAGGKVFCVTEPTRESLGPVLYCLDPKTGKTLWKADCNHVDLLPSDVQEKVKEALKTEREYMYAFDDVRHRYKKAQKGLPETADKLNKIKAECEKLGMVGVCGATSDGKLDGRERSVHLAWDQGKYDPPQIKENRKFLTKFGYNWFVDPWILCGSGAIGYAPSTPCSDGERVYVATAFFDLYCFDMDGKLLWKKYIPHDELNNNGDFRASFFPSPMLYDDLLIRYWANDSVRKGGMSVRAYDKRTGKEVWRAGKGGVFPYALGTPLRMEIDGVKLLYLADGRVLRLKDGKQVADGMGYAAHGKPDCVSGNIVIASTGQEGGGYNGKKARELPRGHLLAYRLTWADDGHEKLKVEELWRGKYDCRTIIYKDLLYSVGRKQGLRVIEPLTGKVVHSRGGRQYVKELGKNFRMYSNHYLTIAGDHLFLSDRGVHSVVTPKGKYVSTVTDIPEERGNGSYKRGKFNPRPQYAGQLFHSGNRSFYLQNMYHPKLVCIGDPKEKTRLSKAHR